MQIENNETVLRLLFQKTMDKFKLTSINTKGVLHALRGIMTTKELRRMFFILESLSPEMKTLEMEILEGYREDVLGRLIKDHLFIARHKEFHIVRRPQILLTYIYIGKICLAISERQLVMGEKGTLVVAEIGAFQYLPKPNRATTVGTVLKSWGATHQQVDQFLQENYVNQPHQEQVNIFYDEELNLLKYDKTGKFVGAIPEPRMIATISVRKGRTTPSEQTNPVLEVLEDDGEEPT